MGVLNFTNCTLLVFFLYITFTAKSFYEIFFPSDCQSFDSKPNDCIYSIPDWQKQFTLSLCIPHTGRYPSQSSDCAQFLKFTDLDLKESFTNELKIDIPKRTQKNGTLSAYVILTRNKHIKSDKSFRFSVNTNSIIKELPLTKYKTNSSEKYVNLLQSKPNSESSNEKKKGKKNTNKKIMTHLLKSVTIYTMDSQIDFNRYNVPHEIISDMIVIENNQFLPHIHISKLSMKEDEYQVLNVSQTQYTLKIDHAPSSVGKLRFFKQLEASLNSMKELGFNDAQLSELTGLFTDTNLYILFLTFIVSLFHLLFEFLAFKNDINFWRRRKTTVGLSLKTLAWRSVSQIIIFIYLMMEESSIIILVPAAISIFIELWKMGRAFKLKIEFQGFTSLPKIYLGESSKAEQETNSYDSIAMKKLSYILYPLCIGGAIYSLVYNTHKNWHSWLVNSLVNGVYAFGFLFMTPQLFLNYKLKSVAHLPWKAFMYKAFNTFIDDVFAFIIKMPTMHRLACLRDDLIFVIYLYQRWLYPIDKTRTNEFGESFDDQDDESKKLKEE